jgi:hypothetical protein
MVVLLNVRGLATHRMRGSNIYSPSLDSRFAR